MYNHVGVFNSDAAVLQKQFSNAYIREHDVKSVGLCSSDVI